MSRFWKIALIVLAVVVIAVVGIRMLHKPGDGAAKGANGKGGDAPPVPVTVVPVVKQNVPVYLTALGTVQALNTVTVIPQVSGRLLSIEFTEGQPVKQGQVLARIDPRTFQANYDQAVSRRKQDQSLLATARSNYQRSQDPKYSQYVAKIDQVTQKNTVAQYEAAVAADEAAIRDAKVQLDYTEIRSPIDGLAGIRAVDPGNVVTTSSAIVTLTQLHPINVMFTLPEQNLDMVRSAAQGGKPLEVTALDRVDAHPIASGGVLKVIDNQIDTSTGTVKVKAEFGNDDERLFPNQFVNVKLMLDTLHDATVIPASALQRGANGLFVYVIGDDDRVSVRNVKTGVSEGDRVQVIDGLRPGERVVTDGSDRLRDGSKVTVPTMPGGGAASSLVDTMPSPAADAASGRRNGGHRRGNWGSGKWGSGARDGGWSHSRKRDDASGSDRGDGG